MNKAEKYFTFMVLYILVAGQSIDPDSWIGFFGLAGCLVVALVYFALFIRESFIKE